MNKKQLVLLIVGFAIVIALVVYAVEPLQQAARSLLLTEAPVLLSFQEGHSLLL